MITKLDKLTLSELEVLSEDFRSSEPFNYIVLDNFLEEDTALQIAKEFPNFEDPNWYSYENALEIKKATNNWNVFGPTTYQFFTHVLSDEFTEKIEKLITGDFNKSIISDIGLHGGGFHSHKSGGKLNPHLDYSIHPKNKKERVANLIVYINPNWKSEYGGKFGLWSHDSETSNPGELSKSVDCIFNRAVIFNTTQNSWHGICDELQSPEGITRNSLATYYLREPSSSADSRMKVRYAPTGDQIGDPNIEDLIKARLSNESFSSVYIKK
jgi:Rps23 Pro-64 3,4-dihydroxylase Tpa1-like proline 4-hydroxylase